MNHRKLPRTIGWIVAAVFACLLPARADTPETIFIADLDTNIPGDYHAVALDMSNAIETAFSERRRVFHVLERRKTNDIVRYRKQELTDLSQGKPASQKLKEQLGADAVVMGELKQTLDGVVLTVALIRLDSEKLWQAQRKHSLYEWLSTDVREKEAESLAAAAAAAMLPPTQEPDDAGDGQRGMEKAKAGQCAEALPLLRNGAAVQRTNAELSFWIGKCSNEAGDFEEAARALTGAISRNPRRADFFTERARSFIGENQLERAIEDLDSAARLNPNNLAATELRGDVLMKLGQYNEAVDAYYTVYRQDETESSCSKLANAYEKNGAAAAAVKLKHACDGLRQGR